MTSGHRFLSRADIAIAAAGAYAPTLEAEGKVLPGSRSAVAQSPIRCEPLRKVRR